MADDLFAHADQVEAQAAIDAAERAREEAAKVAIKNRRCKTLEHENALVQATNEALAAFVQGQRRVGEVRR